MRSSPSRPGEHAAAGTEAEGGRGCRRERERAQRRLGRALWRVGGLIGELCAEKMMAAALAGRQREVSGVMSWELYYLLYAPVKRMGPILF
jgi:hypothetical protein